MNNTIKDFFCALLLIVVILLAFSLTAHSQPGSGPFPTPGGGTSSISNIFAGTGLTGVTNAANVTLTATSGASSYTDTNRMFFRVAAPAQGFSYAVGTANGGEGLFGEYSYDGITWTAFTMNGANQYTNMIGVHDPGLHIGTDGNFYVPHTLQSSNLNSVATNYGLIASSDLVNWYPVGTGVIPYNASVTGISWSPDWITVNGSELIYGESRTSSGTFDGKVRGITANNAAYTSWTAPSSTILLATNESTVPTNNIPYGAGTGLADPYCFNVATNTYLTNSAGQSLLMPAGTFLLIAYNWNTVNYDAYTNTQANMPAQCHLALTNVTGFTSGSEAGMFIQLPNGNYRFYGADGGINGSPNQGRFFYCDNTNGMIGGWSTINYCPEIPRSTFGQGSMVILSGTNLLKLQAAIAQTRQQTNPMKGSIASYSVRKMLGYTGPIMDVRRSSDNGIVSLYSDSTGRLDTNTLMTFVGSGSGFVTCWYDQSGNGNNVVQITNASQPTIVAAGGLKVDGNGFPTVAWASPMSLSSTRPVYITGGLSTVGWYGRNWNTAAYAMVFETADYGLTTGYGFLNSAGSVSQNWIARSMVVASSGYNATIAPFYAGVIVTPTDAFVDATNNGTFYEVETVVGSTNTGIWINGALDNVFVLKATNGLARYSLTNFFIGGNPISTDYQDGNISEITIWDYTIQPMQQQAARVSLVSYFTGAAPLLSATVNSIQADKINVKYGIIDNGPTTNRPAVFINNTLSNAPSITDGQVYVADAATAGGLKATNFPPVFSNNYRAGQQSIANLSTSQAVTFSSALSGTNYSVSINADGTLAAAVGFGVASKTTGGFTITLSGGVTGGVVVDYIAWINQ